MTTFQDLGIADSLAAALAAKGIAEPTPIQEKAIPELLAGHDIIGRQAPGVPAATTHGPRDQPP